jgi:glycosyltransferase involved in cell wall biosynthesis
MDERIHVFEVTKSSGGVGEVVRWIVEGLDKSRFRLTVACLSEGGPQLAGELSQIPGVQAFDLWMNRYKIDPLSDARVCTHLARQIRRERFDLVHAHASKPGFLARLAAAGTGMPVLYSPHCFAFHAGAGRIEAALIAGLERFAARFLTARIITVSDGERALARRHGVGRDGQFVTIHSGMDLRSSHRPIDVAAMRTSLGVPAHAPLVGAVGRLNPQKAPLDFVRAAARVHSQRPDTHFIWVGTGPLAAQAHAATEKNGLANVFHFAGQRIDVHDILRALDVFVLASRWEGFPLTVLEAMAAGVPVVATDVDGTREAVRHGDNGLLVSRGDPDALARAVLDVLNNPECALRLGRRGRERVEQEFTRERMLASLAQAYEDACEYSSRYRGRGERARRQTKERGQR